MNTIFNRYANLSGVKKDVVVNGISVLVVKMLGLVLTLLMSVVLARSLGVEQFGFYTYVITVATLFAIPANGGTPMLIVRETAKYNVLQKWDYLRGLIRWSYLLTMLFSLIAITGFYALYVFSSNKNLDQGNMLLWVSLLIPATALGMLVSASLRGYKLMFQGTVAEQVLIPLALIVLVTVYQAVSPTQIDASRAMMLMLLSVSFGLLVSYLMLKFNQPKEVLNSSKRLYSSREWFLSMLPFSLISGLQVLNKGVGLLVLGFIVSNSQVGIYKVALQASVLIVFGLGIMNTLIGPYVSSFYQEKDYRKIQKLIAVSTIGSFLFATISSLILIFWGVQLISVSFGEEYIAAYIPLLILAFGQVVSALFGSVGLLLNMSGFENETIKASIMAILANFIMSIALVNYYGMLGVAVAASVSLVFWNVILWVRARQLMNINTFLSLKVS